MVKKRTEDAGGHALLTPRIVVAGALAIADTDGLGALTIRRLAADLGVTPMAIYWHFANKDELLDGMAAGVLEETDLSVDASAGWLDQLGTLLSSMIDVLRTHPCVAVLVATRTVSSEGGLRATEVVLDILRRGGFTPAEATQIARHALSTVANLVGGESGVLVAGDPGEHADVRDRTRRLLAALPPDRYPRLAEAADPLCQGIRPDAYFAFALDLLLAGIGSVAARGR